MKISKNGKLRYAGYLPISKVKEIKKLLKTGLTLEKIAMLTGTTKGNVWMIAKNKTWKDVQPDE